MGQRYSQIKISLHTQNNIHYYSTNYTGQVYMTAVGISTGEDRSIQDSREKELGKIRVTF